MNPLGANLFLLLVVAVGRWWLGNIRGARRTLWSLFRFPAYYLCVSGWQSATLCPKGWELLLPTCVAYWHNNQIVCHICGSNSRVVLASHPTITDTVFSLRLVNQRLVNVPAFSPGRKLVESPYIRMMIRNAFLSSPAMTLARRRKAVETSGTIVIVLLHQISLLNCLVW